LSQDPGSCGSAGTEERRSQNTAIRSAAKIIPATAAARGVLRLLRVSGPAVMPSERSSEVAGGAIGRQSIGSVLRQALTLRRSKQLIAERRRQGRLPNDDKGSTRPFMAAIAAVRQSAEGLREFCLIHRRNGVTEIAGLLVHDGIIR